MRCRMTPFLFRIPFSLGNPPPSTHPFIIRNRMTVYEEEKEKASAAAFVCVGGLYSVYALYNIIVVHYEGSYGRRLLYYIINIVFFCSLFIWMYFNL